MNTCKTCVWFIRFKQTNYGSCAKFGDDELIEEDSAVFDSIKEHGIPLADVGENFGCIHWDE